MTARKYTWTEVYQDRDGDDAPITHRGTEAQFRKAMMAFKSHPFGVGMATEGYAHAMRQAIEEHEGKKP